MLLIQRNSRSLVSGPFFTFCLRQFRAWFYRRLPPSSSSMFLKKLAGYERRWGLERNGFTKEGFFHLFRKRFIQKTHPGIFFELQAGDGLVGSLGLWLERENPPWRVEASEHRPVPAATFALLRPHTPLHRGRKTKWAESDGEPGPEGITVRGSREASGVCRAIRRKQIRPSWVGIWNFRRSRIWFLRMRLLGYRLACVYERMEFYRDSRK